MSVIAKLSIRSRDDFGSGHLITLGCICDNDLMAAYATTEEDKLFTKYSPWGEMKVHTKAGWVLGEVGDSFYAMILGSKEVTSEDFPQAVAYCPLSITSVTDFGDNQARKLDMKDSEGSKKAVEKFNWKMSVDNPPVFDQLKAGHDHKYWLALYPVSKLDRDGVIAAAHG